MQWFKYGAKGLFGCKKCMDLGHMPIDSSKRSHRVISGGLRLKAYSRELDRYGGILQPSKR